MIRLLFLLLGARALRPQWLVLAIAGGLWCLLGVLILLDLSDGRLSVVTDTLGILLGIEGIVEVAAALVLGARQYWRGLLRGLGFLLAGLLVADIPWDNNIAATVLFGSAFLIDGVLRISTAFIVHNSRWRHGIVAGLVEISLSVMILLNYPLSHRLTVPFCLALMLLNSGYSLLTMALQLRGLALGASVTALPMYAARNWHARRILDMSEWDGGPEFVGQQLLVHVWTALGTAEGGHGQPIVTRYIAAVDRNGVVSTGHSSLELPHDLYASHYPATEIDRDSDNFRQALNAGKQNDIEGHFQPSYGEESAGWCPADQTVAFTRFNANALRAYWKVYAQEKTYNLTARNCSSTVAQLLDAAIEGAVYDGRPLRSFFGLLFDPYFWLLYIVRGRAQLMTWTPGLVLDYARLLQHVVENRDHNWGRRLRGALKTRHLRSSTTSNRL